MATSIDQKNFVKTALRLPPELHAAVHEAAQKNSRSYNAELLERIQGSFEGGASRELVLDQAEQIWELRKKLSKSFFAIVQALMVIKDAAPHEQDLLNELQAQVAASQFDALVVLRKTTEELEKARDRGDYEYALELFGVGRAAGEDSSQTPEVGSTDPVNKRPSKKG